jgi:hypothetical protein
MTALSTALLSLAGRRIQIAGSASGSTDPDVVRYAHEFITRLVTNIMKAGGGLVVSAGREPRPDGATADAPSLTFDWTALEAVAECLQQGGGTWLAESGLPIVVVSSEKAESEIPDSRRPLYDTLLRSGRVQVETIMPGSRAAAFLRQRQAAFGDALVILGGGTGVEHSADLYLSRRKPVVPFDLALGASRESGTGGGQRLAKQARAEPNLFLRFRPAFAATEGAALAEIAMRGGAVPATDIANRAIALLCKIARPDAFYVRLLDAKHAKFDAVESFFRNVVDPVIEEARMNRVEIGTDKSDHAFINVAIFESLHFASLAIVDVTGERPNCFIELGYALGNANHVLVTAEDGIKLPFDQEMIPCHFWNASDPFLDRKNALVEFWKRHINRPPIVKIT